MIPTWVIIGLAAFAGAWVGWFFGENQRGRPVMGFFLGALPGPIVCFLVLLLGFPRVALVLGLLHAATGWLLVLAFPDLRQTCPVCGAKIMCDEPVCLQCGREPPPP